MRPKINSQKNASARQATAGLALLVMLTSIVEPSNADQATGLPRPPFDAQTAPAPPSHTQPTQSPPVHDCDRLAGDPRDPDRVAKGVWVLEINFKAALPACQEAVSKFPGSARFEYHLGRTYHGLHDYRTAAIWYRKSAAKAYPPAMSILGVLHANGGGVERDYEMAVFWYRRAADTGNFVAMYNLAIRYADGKGVKKDIPQAISWFERSAAKGHIGSLEGLAFIYLRGENGVRDRSKAVYWFAKAARKGRVDSMYHLAWAYDTGLGIEADSQKSAYWFLQALNARHYLAYRDMIYNHRMWRPATRRQLQVLLKQAGHFSGEVNGVFGADTIRAFVELGRKKRLFIPQ